LWFGNQHAPDETNAVYGTARVLIALADVLRQAPHTQHPEATNGFENARATQGRNYNLAKTGDRPVPLSAALARGAEWLRSVQKKEGSWGTQGEGPASVEETALAVESLAGMAGLPLTPALRRPFREAAMRGTNWLIERVESGEWLHPSPIGFYFAKLWYYERLYPQIFTVAALGRVARMLAEREQRTFPEK